MRGKVSIIDTAQDESGITPAYAGKSGVRDQVVDPVQDHPRVCGEKLNSGSSFLRNIGSPPRMRGKGATPLFAFGHVGITPAYAGKSEEGDSGWSSNQDHPRVCGEKKP